MMYRLWRYFEHLWRKGK